MKKLFVFCLALIFLVVPMTSVYAIDNDLGSKGLIEGHSTSKDNINIMLVDSLSYIATYESSITDNGDGTVLITAETNTINTVDKISMSIYLEWWNGNSWVNVGYWSGSKYDSSTYRQYVTGAVESGQKYRVTVKHTVTENGSTESAESRTSYITIK